MMDALLLQGAFCEAGVGFNDHLTNFEFIKAVTCLYADTAGFFVVGMLVYGAVGLSIYIRTGSVMIPAILLLLTGGAIIPQIASPGVALAAIIVMASGAGVFAFLYYRYSR